MKQVDEILRDYASASWEFKGEAGWDNRIRPSVLTKTYDLVLRPNEIPKGEYFIDVYFDQNGRVVGTSGWMEVSH